MGLSIASLAPQRLRETWRRTQHRLTALEKAQEETGMLLEILLSDAVHSQACELGMHAQPNRRAVVAHLFANMGLKQAVETGTYLGRTTNYLARTFQVPVYSSELVPRYHHAARRLLREVPAVHLHLKDSRAFLRELAGRADITALPTFFYLDAHWYQDLPLADEIDIIAGAWRDYAILVDDFKVPGDDGYAYDDYGPGKCLDMDYLKPVLARNQLRAFFPATRSKDESGGRPGYVVVVPAVNAAATGGCLLLSEHAP